MSRVGWTEIYSLLSHMIVQLEKKTVRFTEEYHIFGWSYSDPKFTGLLLTIADYAHSYSCLIGRKSSDIIPINLADVDIPMPHSFG